MKNILDFFKKNQINGSKTTEAISNGNDLITVDADRYKIPQEFIKQVNEFTARLYPLGELHIPFLHVNA